MRNIYIASSTKILYKITLWTTIKLLILGKSFDLVRFRNDTAFFEC
jgi:hypothetical protein